MEGAADRLRRERAMTWWGAMLPHLKRPPKLDEFVDPRPTIQRQSPEVLQAMCEALAAAWGATKVD